MTPSTRQNRHQDRRFLRCLRATEKHPILSANDELTQRSFRNIVVDIQSPIRTIESQRDFIVQRIGTRQPQRTFRQNQRIVLALAAQVEQRIEYRYGIRLATVVSLLYRQLLDFRFDFIEALVNVDESFRPLRFGLFRILETTSTMGVAAAFLGQRPRRVRDFRGEQRIVISVRIALDDFGISFQEVVNLSQAVDTV